MGRKKLWIDYEEDCKRYSIEVPEEFPVFQVHRFNTGIDFKSNAQARKTLSPNAYMLYMLLVTRYPNRVWELSPLFLFENTPLLPEAIVPALQELAEKGYWTQGEISMAGHTCRSNSFHIWESPEMNQS